MDKHKFPLSRDPPPPPPPHTHTHTHHAHTCKYANMHTHTHTNTHTHANMQTCTHIQTCTHTYTCKHAYTYKHAHTHTHIHTYTCKHAHTYTCKHAHAHTCKHAHTHANMHTHTHTHTHTCKHAHNNLRKLRRKAENAIKDPSCQSIKMNLYDCVTKPLFLLTQRKGNTMKKNYSSPKTLYAVVNKLLDNSPERILPTSTSDFCHKISKIRLNFPDKAVLTTWICWHVLWLSKFEKTTADEICQIVLSHVIKCSPLQKQIWVELINISFEQRSMEYLKNAVVLPLIKNMDSYMDRDILKNYRPVSNLKFCAKLIERVVSIRLHKHMTDNDLLIHQQHSYKKGHSSEHYC